MVFPESFTLELLTTQPGWESAPLSDISRLVHFTDDYLELFLHEARLRDQYILGGSHLDDLDGDPRNAAFLFGPEGLVHRHAKTHVLPVEREWGTTEGDIVTVVELPFATVGITICYEVEIPEVASSLAYQGAEILLCPSYTLGEEGFWRVRHCAAARAIENQVYVVQSGTSADRLSETIPGTWARSSILSPCDSPWPSPNGVLAEQPDQFEGLIRATLDLDLLQENRVSGAAPTFHDRQARRDFYGRLPAPSTGAIR